jgi:hypothetical protein
VASKISAALAAHAGWFKIQNKARNSILTALTNPQDRPFLTHRQLREMSLDDVHYADRVSAAQLDQHNALGEETLAALCEKHTKRLVAIGLTNRNCICCGEETDYFFELACARVCGLCYANNPGAKMCSLKYAKVSLSLHCLCTH